jgi:hypothetical protein
LLTYPLTAWFAHRAGGWDPLLDATFLTMILFAVTGVLSIHGSVVTEVLQGL